MASKTRFGVVFDPQGYGKFYKIADAMGNVTKAVSMNAARQVRNKMQKHIELHSHRTEYGDALRERGITANFMATDYRGDYDSISKSIVVHAKPEYVTVNGQSKMFYSIGAKTRGEGAYVNTDSKRRSAADVLNIVDRGVLFSPNATFKLSGGREGATDNGYFTTRGYEGKRFLYAGNKELGVQAKAANYAMVSVTAKVMKKYVKDRSRFNYDMVAIRELKKQMDAGVES